MGHRILTPALTMIAAAVLAAAGPASAQQQDTAPPRSESPAEHSNVAPKIVPGSSVVQPPDVDPGMTKQTPNIDPGIDKPPANVVKPGEPQPQSPPQAQPR